MTKLFIDGEHGTTGLKIRQRLEMDPTITLLSIPFDERHNLDVRVDYLRSADIVILCLPNEAAEEAVEYLHDYKHIRIIDSSTRFRTDPKWIYGFPELTKGQDENIASARLVSNPGCYATGAISLLRPLREREVLSNSEMLAINAISGYSGGGKKLIHEFENTSETTLNYFSYALNLDHKHLPEMKLYSLLEKTPIFTPNVGRFPQGMLVNIPLDLSSRDLNAQKIHEIYEEHYQGKHNILLCGLEETKQITRLNPEELANTDKLKIYIFENEKENVINLCASLDNLGKGACGAALQNLNLMRGA